LVVNTIEKQLGAPPEAGKLGVLSKIPAKHAEDERTWSARN